MFENIIGQADVLRTISGELAGGSFPRAALFFGPPYAGKLSTALETARVLTCRAGGAEWSCDCLACRNQRELIHPHTVMLGFRYSEVEIAASSDALCRSPRLSTQFLFLRAVRKLVRRFDPLVWDAEESRMRTAQDRAGRVEELLAAVAPGAELPEGEALAAALEKILEACAELSSLVKNDAVTIGQVRKLSAWARLTASDSRKVAVIENADRMQESARNALLKLLEDPPSGVNLILLTTRRSAVIPTVLSRLRPYPFLPRSEEEERDVLAKIFRDETRRFPGLRAFFLAWKQLNPEALARMSAAFLENVTAGSGPAPDILAELAELTTGGAAREGAAAFLEDLVGYLGGILRQGAAPLETLEAWNACVREAVSRLELYNMSAQTVLESLFLQMRAAWAAGIPAAGGGRAAAGAGSAFPRGGPA
jgi:DNA polymerase III subunit delta'